jgi:transglutaminase-like putative cysteine protease
VKKIIFSFLIILFLTYSKNITFAAASSPSDYNVTYTVNQNTNAHVDVRVTLTNQENDTFFSSYNLQLGYNDIKNLTAADSVGSISPAIEKNNKGSLVKLKFNDKVVGIGKQLAFSMSFDTSEVAENRGNVWEINIPGIAEKNDFNSFNVKVIYPSNIGRPVYIKPSIPSEMSGKNGNVLNFTKDDLGTSGISVAFGDYQIYSFDLAYHLKNSNLYPIRTEIAIPPETNYQEITIDDMSPKPSNVRMDEDGNWLAEYSLRPSEFKNIRVTGKVKVNLNPKEEALTDKQKNDYLSQKPYWEVNNPKIQELAKELRTPYAIYLYVAKNLTYDFSRVTQRDQRLGAKAILDNPKSAVCLEFTDLFITLARAAGIPAREINGFAYAKNPEERPLSLFKDVLHAWPEYYDFAKKTWVMVDPTWGNTTGGIDYFFNLDTDHFTFIQKGESSTYPVPAGGYKLSENSNQKDVLVKINTDFKKTQDYNLVANFPVLAFSAVPVKGSIKLVNTGNSVLENKLISISTIFLRPQLQNITINKILPFSNVEKNVEFNKVPFLTKRADTITIRLGDTVKYINVQISPYFFSKRYILGGAIFVISIIILSTAIYLSRRIFVPRQKGDNNLRGQG